MTTSRFNYLAFAILLAAIAIALTCGCSSIAPSSTNGPLLLQPVLDRIVPADFVGDGDFGEVGVYVNLQIKAGNLHKLPSGQWTWNWLAYRRIVTIPLAPGLPYRQEGWVTLGTPVPKP